MIGRLIGRLEDGDGDALLLDVNGVGYDVLCPLGTRGRAATLADGRQVILVHTHVREDQLTLFGFADEADRGAFRQLIGVSNVGPKIAIAILSSMTAGELGRAIAHKELARLTAISGVGKKTAERLLLELKDKLVAGPLPPGGPPRKPGATSAVPDADVLTATLVKMGYRPAEVLRVLPALDAAVEPTADLAVRLREALQLLAK